MFVWTIDDIFGLIILAAAIIYGVYFFISTGKATKEQKNANSIEYKKQQREAAAIKNKKQRPIEWYWLVLAAIIFICICLLFAK